MKAIFVEYYSISGDSHSYPIATFSEDQVETMEKILLELKQKEKDESMSFYSRDYDAPIHNPPSLEFLERENKQQALKEAIKPPKKEPVYHDNIGNDPLW